MTGLDAETVWDLSSREEQLLGGTKPLLWQPGGGAAVQPRSGHGAPCLESCTDDRMKGDPCVPLSLKGELTEIYSDSRTLTPSFKRGTKK